eukprot:1141041-Pelagomonas_calceolata.AAC.4
MQRSLPKHVPWGLQCLHFSHSCTVYKCASAFSLTFIAWLTTVPPLQPDLTFMVYKCASVYGLRVHNRASASA